MRVCGGGLFSKKRIIFYYKIALRIQLWLQCVYVVSHFSMRACFLQFEGAQNKKVLLVVQKEYLRA
jgi:hypothetical protein